MVELGILGTTTDHLLASTQIRAVSTKVVSSVQLSRYQSAAQEVSHTGFQTKQRFLEAG